MKVRSRVTFGGDMDDQQFRSTLSPSNLKRLRKEASKGVGNKKRLTVIKNEIMICQNQLTQVQPTATNGRTSIWDLMNKKKVNKSSLNSSHSVDKRVAISPISMSIGKAFKYEPNSKYNIIVPSRRERCFSCNTSTHNEKNLLLLSNKIRVLQDEVKDYFSGTTTNRYGVCNSSPKAEQAKRLTIDIYRVGYVKPFNKKKDENYQASVIQEEWRKYRELKIEREYKRVKYCRLLCKKVNAIHLNYYMKLRQLFLYRWSIIKPKEYEVTAADYFLIQHMKELGIRSIHEFRRTVNSIIVNLEINNGNYY